MLSSRLTRCRAQAGIVAALVAGTTLAAPAAAHAIQGSTNIVHRTNPADRGKTKPADHWRRLTRIPKPDEVDLHKGLLRRENFAKTTLRDARVTVAKAREGSTAVVAIVHPAHKGQAEFVSYERVTSMRQSAKRWNWGASSWKGIAIQPLRVSDSGTLEKDVDSRGGVMAPRYVSKDLISVVTRTDVRGDRNPRAYLRFEDPKDRPSGR